MATQIQSIAPSAMQWLEIQKSSRVLHVFDRSCNLINSDGKILSLVDPLIGNGPFSAVLNANGLLKHVSASDHVEVRQISIVLGTLEIAFDDAEIWNSKPDWVLLENKKEDLLDASNIIESVLGQSAPPQSFAEIVLEIPKHFDANDAIFKKAKVLISELFLGLKSENSLTMRNSAKSLAGLGVGLTPAGDDFLVGLMFAIWAWMPAQKAKEISSEIAQVSAPLTNSISAAWLKTAANGEAAESWHDLFKAIVKNDDAGISKSVLRILPSGHTSGADALGAFAASIRVLAKKDKAL